MPMRYVIVGSGIAGLSAAEEVRRLDPAAAISMVSEESHPIYSRPGLAYLLRGDIPEKLLAVRTPNELARLRLHRIVGRVEHLRWDLHELHLANGQKVPYDRLLLSTGALAVPPAFRGADLNGIVTLDGLDDARRIMKLARKAKSAVVVGGGITALELVEGLNARGVKVHYFLRGERYWSDVLDETESQIVHDRLTHEGVQLHTNTQIEQVVGSGGKVAAVRTQAGEQISCQLVAVAIGVRPRADLARQAGLAVDRGVLVDSHLRTNAADVFAAGDVAQITDPQTGVAALDVLWPSALAQGKIAGANMAGQQCPYVKQTAFNVTQLAGLRVTVIGAIGGGANADLVAITRGESESWRAPTKSSIFSQRDQTNRIRLKFGERTIVGALVMGDQTWSRPLERLISEQADIMAVRPALLEGGAAALGQLAEFCRRQNGGCESFSTNSSPRL
jgi:NAD(P)H-nitrite reductase large subunit